MTHLKRRTGFILVLLLVLSALLVACGSSTSSPVATPGQTSNVQGDFAGQILTGVPVPIDVAFSTDGQQVMAYFCTDITYKTTSHMQVAQWFKGPERNNRVNLTAGGSHLVATVTATTVSGTTTFAAGTTYPFTATRSAVQEEDAYYHTQGGIYRSEQTMGGVRYLAGWIILNVDMPTIPAQASPTVGGHLARLSPADTFCWRIGGAIKNEQTGASLAAPVPTRAELAAHRIVVPGLGTFALTVI